MGLEDANKNLEIFQNLIDLEKCGDFKGNLKVGVDLGTANIVISVVDEDNKPIAGASSPATVVKDGLVVDFMGAVEIVRNLKSKVETILGQKITCASCAIPPGIDPADAKTIGNVLGSCDIDVVNILDEPTAASLVLGILDGAVVDVGGGTTGVSILKDGKVLYTADEPTGGIHMSLVIAGNYKIPVEDAELLKKDIKKEKDNFMLVRPVVEKMAHIVKRHLNGYVVDKIYVVGGACSFKDFEEVFESVTGVETVKPKRPLLVTPLGIAMGSI
jgi:ethanolamine utilization protein EutJ